MADAEVLVTGDSSGESFCVSVWELQSGMQIKTYKGVGCAPHTLSLLGKQYLVAAQENKPVIYVWNIAKEQIHMKQVCPAKVSAVTCSPDGNYCVVACGEKIYIWQVATGHLLVILPGHYQKVTCLVFTDNGTHFLSGGNDNLVMTWNMTQVLSKNSGMTRTQDQSLAPRHTWSDHSLPVTDIHCGCGGLKAHVFTSSLDQTCKIYSLGSGELLCSIVFDCGITAIAIDPSEYHLFAGGFHGNICQVNLYNPALKEVNHVENDHSQIFKGHSKPITSLSVSMDGSLLVSGSHDCTARTWHIPSRQCTRTITHKGAVTSAKIIHRPSNINEPLPKNLWPPVQPFKRHVHSQGNETNKDDSSGDVPMVLNESLTEVSCDIETDIQNILDEYCLDIQSDGTNNPNLDRQELLHQVSQLQKVNQDLYQFAVDELMLKVKENLENS